MSDLSISVLRWGLATSDAEGRASDNNDLDWADLIRYGDSPMTWSIRSPSIGWRLKWRCSESEGLRCWHVAVFRFALGPLVNFFFFFFYKAFSDFWFKPLGIEALLCLFVCFFFFWDSMGLQFATSIIYWACCGLGSITIFFLIF